MKKPNKKEMQRRVSTNKILTSALDLFVKYGYLATTIDIIASNSNLTKGAVYFYFKTKGSIMLKLLERAEENIVIPIEEYLDMTAPNAADKLVKFIHHQSDLGATHPKLILLLILASIEFSDSGCKIGERINDIYSRMYTHIEQIIKQGQKTGIFRTDIAYHELAAIVMAGHDGVLIEWYRRPQDLDGPSLAKALRATLLNGLLSCNSSNSLENPNLELNKSTI